MAPRERLVGAESRKPGKRRDGPQTERNRGDSMTARDRPGPESGSSSGKTTGGDGGSNAAGSSFVAPSLWEGWYAAASPAQREQLLDQARLQGLLFAHQLPTPERQKTPTHLTQTL